MLTQTKTTNDRTPCQEPMAMGNGVTVQTAHHQEFVVVLALETEPTEGNREAVRQVMYLAIWDSDPGRTWCLESARRFGSELAARRALAKVRRENPGRKFPYAHVRAVQTTVAASFPDLLVIPGGRRVNFHQVTPAEAPRTEAE